MPLGSSGLSFLRSLLRPSVHRYRAARVRRAQWKIRLDPSQVTFRDNSNRVEVSRGLFRRKRRVAVVLAIGASNIANEGDPQGCFTPARGVYNFNFLDGKCYVAKDPLLGATIDRSNVLTRLGDRMVACGLYDQVLLVPIGYGGTYIVEWAPDGRMHPRLIEALKMLRRARIRPTHILWQQGEAEGNRPCNESDVTSWIENFAKITDIIRARGIKAPIYVAQCTICHGSPCQSIRRAQAAVNRPEHGIFAGPDLDTIGIDQRWDGCHFSASGMDSAASLWFEAIASSDQIAQQTKKTNGVHRARAFAQRIFGFSTVAGA
jgi:hypothetical protein